jgi:mono/diheme cytochrome c family protein
MPRRASFLALRARNRLARRRLAIAVAAAALGAGACGEQGIQLAKSDRDYRGAEIFNESCGGCHTLDAAGTQGSAYDANGREYVDGPNFEARKESVDQVLYAIHNGGFSSGPMPQDIVVGDRAQAVAEFVAQYSGREAAGG